MQELEDLIDKLINEAKDYGAAQVSDDCDAKYRILCEETMRIAKKKLMKAIQEKI